MQLHGGKKKDGEKAYLNRVCESSVCVCVWGGGSVFVCGGREGAVCVMCVCVCERERERERERELELELELENFILQGL